MSRRTRTVSTCRSTSELLQRVDPTPGIEPGRGGSADRRLPTWPGRVFVVVWHQGKDSNPHSVVQSHVPYRLDHPGAVRYGALDGDRTRLELLDRQSSPPEDGEGAKKKGVVVVRRGGFAPPHGVSTRGYGPLGSLVPEPARVPPRVVLACHAYSVFNVRVPDLGKNKRGLASPGPLLTPLFSGGSSSHSHVGDSRPGDARMDSCPRTDALAGIRGGR